jgi:hypothetical protein
MLYRHLCEGQQENLCERKFCSWRWPDHCIKEKTDRARGVSVSIFVVHLAQLRLRDFRNYTRLDEQFTPGFHLLLGDNAQGKTNILEAIYLLATLR